MIVASLNEYSNNGCTANDVCKEFDDSKDSEKVCFTLFDGPIVVAIIYHIAEWIRTTVALCSALVGVNLIQIYYGMGLATVPLGLVSVIYTAVERFGESNAVCEEFKPTRYTITLLEFLLILILLPFVSLPSFIVFKTFKEEDLQEWEKEPEDEEEEEEE